jgi:inositol transporter-like SP family MFS transporter
MHTAKKPNPWFVGVVAGMASYIDAAAIVSFSTAIVIYQTVLGLTGDQVGWASGSLTIGIAVGALVGGKLGDRFGRRPVFSVTMGIIIIGALILFFARDFPLLIVGSMLVGFGTGADLPVSLATISEAADDSNRGKILSVSQALWMAGILAAVFIGMTWGNAGQLCAQIIFGHIIVIAAIVLAFRIALPESPVWLAQKEAAAIAPAGTQQEGHTVKDLFAKAYLVPLVALMVFYSMVNVGANTAGQFTTYLLVNVAKTDVATAVSVSLYLMPVALLMIFVFMRVVDTKWRFLAFTIGAAMVLLSYLWLVVFDFTFTNYLISAILGVVGASFAGETIMKVWTQEQFPTGLRATAQGTIISIARFVAAGMAVVTPALAAVGPRVLYLIVFGAAALGLVWAWLVFRKRDGHSEFTHAAVSPEPVLTES